MDKEYIPESLFAKLRCTYSTLLMQESIVYENHTGEQCSIGHTQTMNALHSTAGSLLSKQRDVRIFVAVYSD